MSDSKPISEALAETIDILGDEAMMAALRQGLEESRAGMGVSWEDAKKTLGS